METLTATKNNVQVVQKAFDDFLKGNISAVVDISTDDVEWSSYDNPDVPYATTYHGKKGVAQFFSNLAETINYTKFEPRQFVSQGDDVVVFGRHAASVKATGKTFDHEWCFSFKMRNGKVQRFFAYVDSRDQAQAFS